MVSAFVSSVVSEAGEGVADGESALFCALLVGGEFVEVAGEFVDVDGVGELGGAHGQCAESSAVPGVDECGGQVGKVVAAGQCRVVAWGDRGEKNIEGAAALATRGQASVDEFGAQG